MSEKKETLKALPPPAPAKPKEELLTIEEHAQNEGHVNVAPPRGQRIDPYKQKDFIYQMVKTHKSLGTGYRCTRSEYLEAVESALNVGVQ